MSTLEMDMDLQQQLTAIEMKIDELGQMAAIGGKSILDLHEAALFTGYSDDHIYRLTSRRQIPHYKKNRKLYFRKDELERWLLSDYVRTERDIQNEATTYVATHKRKGNRVR